jgi:hypothetical protein
VRENQKGVVQREKAGVFFVKEAISQELYMRGMRGTCFLGELDGRRRYNIFRCNYRVAIV